MTDPRLSKVSEGFPRGENIHGLTDSRFHGYSCFPVGFISSEEIPQKTLISVNPSNRESVERSRGLTDSRIHGYHRFLEEKLRMPRCTDVRIHGYTDICSVIVKFDHIRRYPRLFRYIRQPLDISREPIQSDIWASPGRMPDINTSHAKRMAAALALL